MKITYFGTTMLLLDDGRDQLLLDCHVSRPSLPKFLFGKLRTDCAVAERVIREFEIHRLRAMLISHSHHDHAMDVPFFARTCHCDVFGSASTLQIARGGGIPEEQLRQFRANQTLEIGKFRITVLASLHSKPSFLNNNLGQTIETPLHQPARGRDYKEGGSYDFLIGHEDRRILVRPSCNYIPGQLENIRADVLFLGIAGLAQDTAERKAQFWAETVDTVKPKLVIPLHWDNFFTPLYAPLTRLPKMFEFTGKAMHELALACAARDIRCVVQLPLTCMEL